MLNFASKSLFFSLYLKKIHLSKILKDKTYTNIIAQGSVMSTETSEILKYKNCNLIKKFYNVKNRTNTEISIKIPAYIFP